MEIEAQAVDFTSLYQAELPYVWATLRRMGAPERHLEDLAHDVFIAAYHRLGTYDSSRPLRPWLFGIAFRVASDFRRRVQNAREVVDEAHDVEDEKPAPDDQVHAAQRRRLVHEALEAIEEDRRAVFVMHELNGHSIPEVAEALSVPLNTAYSRLRLAREEFTAAVRRIQLRRGEA